MPAGGSAHTSHQAAQSCACAPRRVPGATARRVYHKVQYTRVHQSVTNANGNIKYLGQNTLRTFWLIFKTEAEIQPCGPSDCVHCQKCHCDHQRLYNVVPNGSHSQGHTHAHTHLLTDFDRLNCVDSRHSHSILSPSSTPPRSLILHQEMSSRHEHSQTQHSHGSLACSSPTHLI
jgi:hypothetical protein